MIGQHAVTALPLADGGMSLFIDMSIDVEVLGVTVFTFHHRSLETWRLGWVQSVEASTNNDGVEEHCRVRRVADGLQVDGAAFQGVHDAEIAPSSYWNIETLDAPDWFSTQTGARLGVSIARSGGRAVVSGGLDAVALYDDAGEWRGLELEAAGQQVRYEQRSPGPDLRRMLTDSRR